MSALLDSFLTRAVLAGLGVALAAGPLGTFIVWRRMAYFGDATTHAAILGVALSLSLSISIFAGALAMALLMAITVSTLSDRTHGMDTLLGVLAHSALAVGLFAVSFLDGVSIDLSAYLFGDILAVARRDLVVIWGGAILVLGLLSMRWSALLTATLSPELAYAAGIDPRREQLILTVALAIVVAVAIKVVGVLLIAALLIIPAAAARPFAHTPEQMAVVAACLGGASAFGGMAAAWVFDTPAGPTIVCVAAAFFLISSLVRLVRAA